MGFVDLVVSDKRAAVSSEDEVKGAISSFQAVFKNASQDAGAKCADDVGSVKKKLAAAKDSAARADNEPALWYQPWRPVLFNEVHASFSSLCELLSNFIGQVGDNRAELLGKLPNYNAVCEELIKSLDRMSGTSTAVL